MMSSPPNLSGPTSTLHISVAHTHTVVVCGSESEDSATLGNVVNGSAESTRRKNVQSAFLIGPQGPMGQFNSSPQDTWRQSSMTPNACQRIYAFSANLALLAATSVRFGSRHDISAECCLLVLPSHHINLRLPVHLGWCVNFFYLICLSFFFPFKFVKTPN